MKDPVISVIMGVYNQWDEIALNRAVKSVLDQSFSDFEFIIWNDGSDERCVRILEKLPMMDKRIRLAGCDENRGLAFSLNECIKLARGKYVARMDADDECLTERFAEQIRFLESHPEYSWCGCSAELFDENGVWGVRHMPGKPTGKDYYKYSPYIHPSVMFRREIFNDENGYLVSSETLRCEDYELFMNFSSKGLKGFNLSEVLFRYRETDDSYHRRKFINRLNESKIRFRCFKKMGILFPIGFLYVFRPMVGLLMPSGFIGLVKRAEGVRAMNGRRQIIEPEYDIRRTFENIPGLYRLGAGLQGKSKSLS